MKILLKKNPTKVNVDNGEEMEKIWQNSADKNH